MYGVVHTVYGVWSGRDFVHYSVISYTYGEIVASGGIYCYICAASKPQWPNESSYPKERNWYVYRQTV